MDAMYLSPDALFQMYCNSPMYDYNFLNILNKELVKDAAHA